MGSAAPGPPVAVHASSAAIVPGAAATPLVHAIVQAQPAELAVPSSCPPPPATDAEVSIQSRYTMLTHALQFVVETNGVLTGNVAVVALNTIRGVPAHVWTLAIVAPPGVPKAVYAAGLFEVMAQGGAAPAIRLEDRGGLWVEIVDAVDGMTRVATVSAWPDALAHDVTGDESTWIVPVMHNGMTWLPRCYRPPVLRAQAVLQHATQLVARLDEVMATRVTRGMMGGIWPNGASPASGCATTVARPGERDDGTSDGAASADAPQTLQLVQAFHGAAGPGTGTGTGTATWTPDTSPDDAARAAAAQQDRVNHQAADGTTFVAVAMGGGVDQFFPTTIWAYADAWARALMQLPHLNPGWCPPETIPGLRWDAVIRLQQCAHDILYQTLVQGMTHVTPLQAMLAAGIHVPEGIPHFLSLTFLGAPAEVLG